MITITLFLSPLPGGAFGSIKRKGIFPLTARQGPAISRKKNVNDKNILPNPVVITLPVEIIDMV